MVCSNKNCPEGSNSNPLFACFGPCGNLYHAKCVGSTNGFIEKISTSKFAYWYCHDCRKLSLSQLAFKMSSFKADILKLSKGFEELLKSFNSAVSNLNSFTVTNIMIDSSTSTDDLAQPKSPTTFPSANEDLLAQSGSGVKNIESVSDGSKKNSKKRSRENSMQAKNSTPPPNEQISILPQ